MTYRSMAVRGLAWGGAFALASIGLIACPGGGGGGNCPEISGDWTVNGCNASGCEITQTGCSITVACENGSTYSGSVTKSSASFSDEDVSCSGTLSDLDDTDGDGDVQPELSGSCRPKEGDACEFTATCLRGDCRVPEEDSNGGNDEGGGGSGGRSGNGGSSGFLGGSGIGGGDGDGDGDGDAGQGGFSGGTSGTGGFGGDGGTSGTSGDGTVDPQACVPCVLTECASDVSACEAYEDCVTIVNCALESMCSLDDVDCIDVYCEQVFAPLPDLSSAVEQAVFDVQACSINSCASECLGGGGPIGGDGDGDGGDGDGDGDGGCSDACDLVDGECDDGGDGAITSICPLGTDCTDCGPR